MSSEILANRIIEIVRSDGDLARSVSAVDPLIEMLKQDGYEHGDELFELWWDAEQVNAIYLGERRSPTDEERDHVRTRLSQIADKLEASPPTVM